MDENFRGSNGIILKRKDMFVQVLIQFICNPNYKDKTKLLHIYFWSYGVTDKIGRYPSHQHICNDLGWSKATVIRTLKMLKEEG